MNIDLKGRLAVVTGAGKGIGRAVALMLAEAGAKVAVNYFNSRREAEEVVKNIRNQGGEAECFQADMTDTAQIEKLEKDVRGHFGEPVDILINNAGHMLERRLNAEMTEQLYHQVMDLNVKSTVFACKVFIPGMREKGGGHIVNMSSLAAHNGGGNGASIYAASKAAVIAYTKGLAKEAAADGIIVNAVAPGFIGNTDFHSKLTSNEAREATIQNVPLGRAGTPYDVAGAILFLVSPICGYITGETIEINGGNYMK